MISYGKVDDVCVCTLMHIMRQIKF